MKQSGVAANNTVRIGEDGMGMIVPPTQVNPSTDGGTPGGTDDSGGAGGQPVSSGGGAGMASIGAGGASVTPGGGGTGGSVINGQPTSAADEGGCSCRMGQTSRSSGGGFFPWQR